MEGILRRLSSEGSEAENAIRVIAFFDRLVETRAGIEELVRSSARLVGAPAGYISEASDPDKAFDARGREINSAIPGGSFVRSVISDSKTSGIVWIQSFSKNATLGDLIIERMAFSAAIILGRSGGGQVRTESTFLGQLISRSASEEDRKNAAWSLGFKEGWDIRILLASVSSGYGLVSSAMQAWSEESKIKSTKAQIDDQFIICMLNDQGDISGKSPLDFNFLSALGSRKNIFQAFDSLETAKKSIHLTSLELGPRFVDFETLGPLMHIAAISPTQARETPLVEQLTYVSQSEIGFGEIIALDTFCKHQSLRAASVEMHMHHSSLAHRLNNIEKKLKVDLNNSQDFLAVGIALQLFRISRWS